MINKIDKTQTLFVAGRFDDHGGRPSKIAQQIYESINPKKSEILNGGPFTELARKIDEEIQEYGLVFWFADVPNDKPKLVRDIKKKHKACILITSKRNTEGKYTFPDLLYHALGIKSNLFLEITRKGKRYYGRVVDPLGNVYLDHNDDFSLVGRVLRKRANELLNYTRIPSKKTGERIEPPDQKGFYETVKHYAEVFHNIIHAHPEATNRFFGNASFRCQRGFPSFRADEELVFVSQRNIDKRYISKQGFVGVKPGRIPVEYYGDKKPSVDTPIQVKLYEYYPNVNYMLHSHTYIERAPFTDEIVPCGALEEAHNIIKKIPDKEATNFAINLKGHGSLVLAETVDQLKNIPYVPRPLPEVHADYAKDL